MPRHDDDEITRRAPEQSLPRLDGRSDDGRLANISPAQHRPADVFRSDEKRSARNESVPMWLRKIQEVLRTHEHSLRGLHRMLTLIAFAHTDPGAPVDV